MRGAGQLDLSPKRRPNLWAGMPPSLIAHVGSGCRIVGPKVLAAVAPARFVLNASWFTRFNCPRGHVRLHCGLGGLHEGVAVCRGGQGGTGPLFHSGGWLFRRAPPFPQCVAVASSPPCGACAIWAVI